MSHSPWLRLFAVLYVTMPTNAYYFSFNTYNLEVSCGYLFTALFCLFSFVWTNERRNWMGFVAASLTAMMAIAIYQSLMFLCVVGIAVAYLLHLEAAGSRTTVTESVVKFVSLLVPLAVGYVLAWIVDFFIVPTRIYVDQFFNWGKLDNAFIYRWLTNYCLAFFRGEGFFGGQIVLPLALFAALALMVFAWRAIKARQIVQLGLFLVVLLSPFLLSFALGTPMPNRSQQVFPLAYSAIILIVMLQLGLQHRGELIALILSVLVIMWNGQANTRLFLSEYLAFERDKVVANELAARLYQLAGRVRLRHWSLSGVTRIRRSVTF